MIEARPGGSRAPLVLAAALFFAVGLGALVVQTLWLRELQLALGFAAAALSATLAALVIGQAGGARLGERIALRAGNPLLAFGGLALASAALALATPALLGAATTLLDAHYDALLAAPPALSAARFAAALLATLPAALAIGALAPALFAATLGGARSLARTGVGLYALNALGGAAGAALATFGLVPRVGLRGGLVVGAGLLSAAGALALVASRRWGRVAPFGLVSADDGGDAAQPSARAPVPPWLLRLAVLSGFGTFAAQAFFAQALARVSNHSAYASGAVLVVALACVGLGALFTHSLSERTHPLRTLGVSLALTGGALIVFPSAFVAATGGLSPLVADAPWPAYLVDFAVLAVATTAPVLLPAACVFPSLLSAASLLSARDGRSLAASTARLLAWNALGGLAGAVLAPLALGTALGLWDALALTGALYLLGALRPLARGVARRFAAYALVLGALLFVVARPDAQPALRIPPETRVVELEESAAGLVAVFDRRDGLALQLDNTYLLGGARDRVRQERQGHLPLLLHPRPESALFLGSATGSSASAALAHDVEAITLVEIVPGVARSAAAWFRGENHGVYQEARTRIVLDDARSFLRASRVRFDVIVGDLFVPWHAGGGGLYAVEHFANARARLARGGVFCQWLPLYQLTREQFLTIARSFASVFPASDVWRGDFYGAHPIVALCARDGDAAIDALHAARALPASEDRWIAQPAGVRALYVGRIEARWLGEGPIESDASPSLELAAARSHAEMPKAALTGIAWADLSVRIATRPEARAGLLLQAASALHSAGRTQEAATLFAEAAKLLPPP